MRVGPLLGCLLVGEGRTDDEGKEELKGEVTEAHER
jgi:hypothetical protein